MFIVLGATGHVGAAVPQALLARAMPVTAVTHNSKKGDDLARLGAEVAIVDIHDRDALRRLFQTRTRAFLLNPPADVALDTDTEERATAASIVAALDGSGLEKVVVESTFGAQPERIGDLSVLYEFEQAALGQHIPVTIQRGAYYYSNWDTQLEAARSGRITTMFPPDLKIPMVAPTDLGRAAAARLLEPFSGDTDIHLVEGPERYSSRDVAETFAKVLDQPVEVEVVPAAQWSNAYKGLGFSTSAARAYARMTEATVDGECPDLADTEHAPTSLEDHIRALVAGR